MNTPSDQGPIGGVAPHLTVHDGRCREAIVWYQRAFGAEQPMEPMPAAGMTERADDPRVMHAHLRINGGSLMLNDAFPEFAAPEDHSQPGGPVTLHLQVDDADHWFTRAIEAGATENMPLADMFWGDRYGRVKDPFGFTWSIGGPVKQA